MITPILEKLLLSGEAVFKTASLGYNGLFCLELPPQKTAIITQINIEPFLNVVTPGSLIETYFEDLTEAGLTNATNVEVLTRIEYQLRIYSNDGRVNQSFNLRNPVQMQWVPGKMDLGSGENTLSMRVHPLMTPRKLDTFFYIEAKTYFFLAYWDFIASFPALQVSDYATVFNNITPFPGLPFGPTNTSLLALEALVLPFPEGYSYVPLGLVDTNTTYNNITNTVQKPVQQDVSTILLPVVAGPAVALAPGQLPSLPLVNVSYIEINRRSGTHGIFEKALSENDLF